LENLFLFSVFWRRKLISMREEGMSEQEEGEGEK
jgi:hypothetical protein